MWRRIYPQVVLLIFVNIIFKVSCKGNGSLTFVIDETKSMHDDLDHIRKSVDKIARYVKNEKSSLINDMVLVTFNDPGINERIVTNDTDEFKRELDNVSAINEVASNDCWEPSMKALRYALNNSQNDSFIFVFTDAAAKDYKDSPYVIEMCQKKQTQIVFVLTGSLCMKIENIEAIYESRNVYFDIAVACSGLAMFVDKEEVGKVFGPIEEIIKGNKTVIATATLPANDSQNIPFAIDDYTDYVIVCASGRDVNIKLNYPPLSVQPIMTTKNTIVLKLINIKSGNYVANVMSTTNTSVIIIGRTDFFFTHGFSELRPESLSDTSPQPKSDAKVYLAISVTSDHRSVRIETAKILDMDGRPIMGKLPLTQISTDFYITHPFVAPTQRFKVAIEGTTVTRKPITRTAKIPVTPSPPNIAPKVEGLRGKLVSKGVTAFIECNVSGFPAPSIKWQFRNHKYSNYKDLAGSKSVLRIANVDDTHAGHYLCVATNEAGKDSHNTRLYVEGPPKIIPSVSKMYESTEGDAWLRIPCVATGRPKPSINWRLNNHVIESSMKYSIEKGTLIIRDPKVSDTNVYTCEAKNKLGNVSATFRTYIYQAPQLSGVSYMKVRKGASATVQCTVVKGEPKPTITWQFINNSGSELPVLGSDKVLIPKVEYKDAGRYKCVATNKVASYEHITTLEVQDLPKIIPSVSNTYESTEGDALLRIPCVADGQPKPSITWKMNGHVIAPNARFSIENGTLIIKDPKVNDSNLYTCEASNEVGAVSATFRTNIYQAPQLSGVSYMKVRKGASATVQCTVVKGEPKPTITWQFINNSGSELPVLGSDKVLIPKVEYKDAGRYKCVATNKVASYEHITTLEVQDLPKIIPSVSNTYESTEGDALLRIPCVADGQPKPSITWKMNGHVIAPSARFSIENGTLIIKDPKVNDTNLYTCEASNEVGAVSATFRTNIYQAPQLSGVSYMKVRKGASATVQCTVVKGEPKPTITWQFINNSGSELPVLGSDKVLIPKVEYKDAGRYKCVATNKVASYEHITTLEVQDLPKIIPSVSNTYESTEGDALLRIPCVADGQPKPSITWKMNGHVIAPSARFSIENGTLIIKDPKVNDTNLYTCEASNEVGAVSATFRTNIYQAPQLSGVSYMKVRKGASATVQCTVVKGEPKPTITWQFINNSGSELPVLGSDKVLIPKVEYKDAGRYKCVATNKVASYEHITTLEVQDLPKIIPSVSNTYESTEGDALLRIPCVADGQPKPSITWKMNGHVIAPSARFSIENGTLIIKDPKVNDTNLYTCEASNEVGAVSATFRTNIYQAPQLSGVSYMKVRKGASATVQCTVVKGEPKPTITWQFINNSGSELPVLGSDKVLIPKVEYKDAGRYKCVATNKVASYEHITTLEVQDLPKIIPSVSNTYESTEGDALLRIPCVADGQPKPSITWKMNGHVIAPSARFSIENGTLIIKDPKVNDTNLYTCEASNEVGAVSATFRTNIYQAPQLSGVSYMKVRKGASATVQCTVVKGEPKPTITWQFINNSGSELPVLGSDKVLIPKVEYKDAGRYKCVATNKVASYEHITTLEVQDLPKIIPSVSNTYESTEGDALLRIPCVADGQPKPSITWKMNGHVIAPSARFSIENGTLIIKDPKVNDTNLYTCEASNEVGAVSATFRTNIYQAPQLSGVSYMKVRKGASATVQCTVVKGEPKPTITWQFINNSGSELPVLGSDKVLIPKVEYKDAGRYKCVATNKVASYEHITTLEVQDLPKIIPSVSNTYESTEGDALLRIPCVADGQPKPSITWKMNGHVIAPSARFSIENGTLIIKDPKVNDSNLYTCEASNEVGAVSATFRTNIYQAPQLSGVSYMKVRKGASATVQCTVVKGEPKPTITWQFINNSGSELPVLGSDKVLIPKVEYKDAGRYKCVATNKVASYEHITTLEVQDLPKIIPSVSNTYESTEGDALLRIPCVADGQPKPSITWKMNGHVIAPNARFSIENGTFIIKDPKVNDSNLYTCEASNEVGAVSATFRTNIYQAPQLSGVSYMKVRKGASATVQCTVVKGEPKPTITWQFINNSGSELPVLGSDKVLIPKVEYKDAGRYKCVATNKVASYEHITTLEVQDLPKIIPSVSNTYESTEGDALLRIPCVADGQPKPSITWKMNGHVIAPNARFSIENGTFIIKDPKVNDSNLYTCEASNEVGAVSATFRTNIYQAPQLSGVSYMKVRKGASATVQCTVVKGEPKPTITWQFINNSGSELPVLGSDKVLIPKVEYKDAGRYKCVATNKVASYEHITTLEVQDLPKIIPSVSNTYESTEGDALLRIPCIADGQPKPSITWKMNGHVIAPNARFSIENGTFIIKDPKVNDSNLYTCEASNEVGAVSATFRTNIYQAPQLSGVSYMKVRKGASATVQCTVVKGEPKPTITWQFINNSGSELPVLGSDKVLIPKVEYKDAGRYKCVATNKVASYEHITTLEVQDLPKIIPSVSNTYESTEGDALLRIPCIADGQPKPSITWKMNGHVIAPSARFSIENGTLIIKDPKVNDTNLYTCEASNEVGAVSATFRTNIYQAPQLSGVSYMKVRKGASATVQCTVVKGEPKPTITWQFINNSGSELPVLGSDKVLIPKVEYKDAGRYKCVATNKVASYEHITTLEVQDLPKIIPSVSNTYESTEGDALLRIPCVADGQPKPSITWKMNGHVIAPNARFSIENGTLIIKDPKVNDSNLYTCEASNEVGAVSATFRTNIYQAPQLSGVSYMKVRKGASATVQCTVVKGEPKPTITWQFINNSGSELPVLGSDKVLIPKVEYKDAGRYKCVATNKVASYEHITTLEVQDLPKIIPSVSNTYESTEGDALLRIPCIADGQPKPSITWKMNGHVIAPNARFSIENGTLIIKDPKVNDSNLYTCEASNEVGAVSATFRTNIYQAPQLSGVSYMKVRKGASATVQCTVVKGEPKPTITWQFINNSGSELPVLGSDKVLIPKVEYKDAGRYKCVATNKVASYEHITTLEVQDLPKIIPSVSNTYESTEGDALLRIPCVADGQPKPSITWKMNGHVIAPNARFSIENGTLIIKDPKVNDTNLYTCEASNEVGAVSATFRTNIYQAPQLSGVSYMKVRKGASATVQCTVVKGEPKPTITWQFINNSGSELPVLGSDKVLIPKVEYKDAGRYKCVATNKVASYEHITTLEVQDLPKIIPSVSNTYESTEGDALLRIPCVADGQPKPSITWKMNGHVIAPSARFSIENGTLIIKDPKVNDTNLYTCEASNKVGAVSATFRTNIYQAPQISGVSYMKVRKGASATVQCTVVKGEPKPTITWQFINNSGSELPVLGSQKVLIPKVENKDAGRYKCVATNKVGSYEHVTTLIVESPPEITTKSKTVEGIEGDLALRIPCDVTGIPRPVVTWKRNGKKITPDVKYSIVDGALFIVRPEKKDSSSYTCEAKNDVGSVSTTFEAAVAKHPKTVGTMHYVNILKGETKKLECEAYTSESQAVTWFEAKKRRPRSLDVSMSTTTPSPESAETTTISSKEYYSSRRMSTYVLNAGIKEPFIQIPNASYFDDGIYMCRVSDKHGNTHTHTYVVDVGDAPKFLSDDATSLSDWEGEVSHISQKCDTKPILKPKLVIKWTYNGKVLTDFDSAGPGHYTCNVSNALGSVQRSFDVSSSVCLISRNLRDAQYMPLVLDGTGFWNKLENTKHYTIVEKENKIILSCPSQKETSNVFKNFPKKSTLEAYCYKEDSFMVEDKFYKLADLQCTNSIQPSVIRNKVKCSTETSELIRVGYNVPGFLEAYEVCFDTEKNMPLYTRILMTETNTIGLSAGYNWFSYPGIGHKHAEGFTCNDTMSSCCYSKSQLVNVKDFNDGPAKRSTFIDPLNVVPVWLPCNISKPTWETVNNNVTELLPINKDIITWSGTHTFQEINGTTIPRYLWKVLWFDTEAIAIVHVNDPSPREEDVKCKDICDTYVDWIKFNDKYTYCCSLLEFFEAFNIHNIDIGESFNEALEEMKKVSD